MNNTEENIDRLLKFKYHKIKRKLIWELEFMEWFIISCFGSMLLFIIILKEKELIIYYLNFLILAFSFTLMVLSIFQTKLKIEVKTETLILILFNLLVINYKMIIKIIQRNLKKLKLVIQNYL